MKDTLRLKVFDLAEPHLREQEVIAPGAYGPTIKAIHTHTVIELAR